MNLKLDWNTNMKNTLLLFVVSLTFLVAISSCKKTDDGLDELREAEITRLNEYIADNNISVEPKSSGLYYLETQEGTGDSIKIGDTVKIFYTVMSIDSVLYDTSGSYEPFEFVVGSSSIITGLSEGITYMKQGGKATLILPSELAYGATVDYSLGIPRFTTLLFDVEVYRHYKLEE